MGLSLTGVAFETVDIVSRGYYAAPSGERVDIGGAVAAAVGGSRTIAPDDMAAIEARLDTTPRDRTAPATVEVTGERTGEAGRRLVEREGIARAVVLNFANGTHTGGGFLGGARAQEEALCRCSGLYACLESRPDFYGINAREDGALSSDAMILSPDVPFFRDEALDLLETPFTLSVLTAAAPIAHYVRLRPGSADLLRRTIHRRAGRILAVCADHGYRALVLGAWGCGAFGNDPDVVADAFATWIAHPRFAGAFERVVFAVFDTPRGQPNLQAFRARFARTASA